MSGEVVRPVIANAAEAEQWKGKLRGKIVLTQPAREVRMLEGRVVLRMTDKEIEEALTPPATAPAGRAGGAGGRAGAAGGLPEAVPVMRSAREPPLPLDVADPVWVSED